MRPTCSRRFVIGWARFRKEPGPQVAGGPLSELVGRCSNISRGEDLGWVGQCLPVLDCPARLSFDCAGCAGGTGPAAGCERRP